jgi:hypothetical protein
VIRQSLRQFVFEKEYKASVKIVCFQEKPKLWMPAHISGVLWFKSLYLACVEEVV